MGKDWLNCDGCNETFNKQYDDYERCMNCCSTYCENCKDEIQWIDTYYCSSSCKSIDNENNKKENKDETLINTEYINIEKIKFQKAFNLFRNSFTYFQPCYNNKDFKEYFDEILLELKF